MFRIGVVGVQVWGCHSLEQTFAATGRAKVVAVTTSEEWGAHNCPGDPVEFGRAYAERLGGEFVEDWRELVTRPDVDVISAMVCPKRKAEVAIAALKAGKHVIMDKPLALTAPEAQAVLAAERKSAARGFMLAGYQNRPLVERLLAAVHSGQLGDVRAVTIRLCFMGGVYPGFQPSKRWRSEIPSGELTTIGSHALITLLKLHDVRVAEIHALVENRFYEEYRAAGAEDWAELNLAFVDGCRANLTLARLPYRIPGEDMVIEVTGTDGYAELNASGLTIWPGEKTIPPQDGSHVLGATFSAVADALEQNLPMPVSIADGVRLQRVLAAALKSAETNETVPVENDDL